MMKYIVVKLLARKSNLVPTLQKDNMNLKVLVSKDVCLLVTFQWSRTIKYGECILINPFVKMKHSVLRPVTAYYELLRLIPRGIELPLFLLTSGTRIFYSQVQTVLKKKISQIRLNLEFLIIPLIPLILFCM
jgi:hypothetical protein